MVRKKKQWNSEAGSTFLLNLNCCSISFFMVNVSVSLTTVLAGNFNYSLCFVFMILYYVYYYSWAPNTNTNSLYVLNLVNFHNKVHCAIDSEWCMRPFVQGSIILYVGDESAARWKGNGGTRLSFWTQSNTSNSPLSSSPSSFHCSLPATN